ncbi:MAG TPA: thaumatin family protein [Polyangiaceae bacterium]|nr:thaumatin family protein [Polyangiaceae bacterium]
MRLRSVAAGLLVGALGCSSGEDGGNATGGSGSTAGSTSAGTSGGGKGGSGTGNGGQAQSGGNGNPNAGSSNTPSAGSSPTGGNNADAGNGGSSSGGAGSSSGGSATGPIDCRKTGDGKSTITFINHCAGTLEFRGSKIEGGQLKQGEHACRDVGDAMTEIPAIRFWGYIGEDPGGERYTLAELTLNTSFNDFDWYNISHVDASNLPMSVAAVDMPKCRTLSCPNSLLPNCPAVGIVKDSQGNVISCYSPMRDDKNSPVAQYFEMSCKDAYSWSGDDQDSVVACAGEDYDVTFCP